MSMTTQSGQPAAVDRRTAVTAVAALAVLNLVDVVLTRLALGRGAVEANPLARVLLSGGRVELLKLALICVLWARAERRRPTLQFTVACWAAAGAYAMVVLSNLFVVWTVR